VQRTLRRGVCLCSCLRAAVARVLLDMFMQLQLITGGRAWRFDTFPEMGPERCRLRTWPIGPTRMRTHPHTDSHAWVVSSQLGAASCPLSFDPDTLLLQLASLRSSSSGHPAGTASVLCLVSAGRRAPSWWFRVRVDIDPKVLLHLLLLLLLMRRSLTVLVHDRSQRANYVAELRSIAWLELQARVRQRHHLLAAEPVHVQEVPVSRHL